MMIRHGRGRKSGFGRAAAAVAVSLALVLDGAPVFAQRRKAEPEANPDFQNALKGKSDGAPVSDQPAAGGETVTEPASPSADSGSAGTEEKLIEPRSVQSVQIGAAPAARAASVSATAPLDTRVTVRVKGAPLATFLDTISAQAKVNFIITEGLEQKRVTAFLQNVTVREALQVLLEIKGLTYQQIGKSNTYVVTQRSKQAENLITRIYTLSFVPLIPLSTDDSGDDKAAGGASSAPSGGGGSGTQKPCAGKNQKISVARVVCTVLSKSGDIELEPRTNALIVTDIPEVFPQVEQIIAELDRKAPQVMIEAQIVELDSSRTRELGFEWGGASGQLAQFTGGMRDTTFPLNLSPHLSGTHFFDPFVPGVSQLASPLGGSSSTSGDVSTGYNVVGNMRSSLLDLTSLQITLRALVARSEARFLGKPKILTLNNKPAIMEIQAEQAVARQLTQGSAGGSSSLTSATPLYKETGLRLLVTPQINKDGYITMMIQPRYIDAQVSSISTQADPVYDTVIRAASTLVRVRNGQTLVIGGLLQSTESNVVRKVPLLGYIPLIGWFFTSSESLRKNTDLVVFLTPTIVSD